MSYERNTLYRTFTRRAPDELSAALEKKKGKLTSPNFQLVLDSNQAVGHNIVLAFKLLGENDHIINRVAAWWTTERNKNIPGVYPHGQITHVEIMIRVTDDDWRMFSINMMEAKRDHADDPIVYNWGKVHMRTILPSHLHRYTYVSVAMSRQLQHTVYGFLVSQLDHKFNFAGYVMNHVLPCAIGVRNGAKLEPRENTRYMCAELVMIALQIGQVPGSHRFAPCKMSPNSIYNFCCSEDAIGCTGTTNPLASCD
ncbi:hypothetical protein CYMTET_3894 [Cymbomonas tetramitiformis]|uniref:Uncharacterized protein n=1 Tax=Cymbomonas tetramitiformis TaxID=36881 RepID=A0AAE0LKF1_9CHLO|nr:hypothetical protein CYMTET_3894 [Cymbomonas tetramitiformis]